MARIVCGRCSGSGITARRDAEELVACGLCGERGFIDSPHVLPTRPGEAGGLAVPTVHLNGTSRAELGAQLEAVARALRAALAALHNAAPNARDYYPQQDLSDGRRAVAVAEGQHRDRIWRIETVASEIEVLWTFVESDEDERAKARRGAEADPRD